MRASLFSNTTFGSWLSGDARGSIASVRDRRPGDAPTDFRHEHDVPGEPYEDAMPALQHASAERMSGPPIALDLLQAEAILEQFRETAAFRTHTLRAVAIMHNHFHIVVEVSGDPDPKRLLADFKAYATRRLNRSFGRSPSETWWTSRGSKRKLGDARHLANAIHYVLYKQPNPLVVWSPETGRLV